MRAMRRRGHGGRRGRAVVVGRAHPPRPRRPAGAVAPGRAATSCWRSPRRRAAAGAGSIAYLPASAIGGIDADDEDYLIELGAVSGLPGGHPGPGRPQQDRCADRDLGGVAGVPRPRHRSRRARLLDADRPAVRPPDRDRRDELPLPRGAELEPDAEAAARRARRRCCATPPRATSCATRSSTTTATPAQGTTVPPPLWSDGLRRRRRPTRARRSSSRARSPTSPTSAASRPPTRCSTSRSPKTSPPSSAGAPRARSGPRPWARRSSTRA